MTITLSPFTAWAVFTWRNCGPPQTPLAGESPRATQKPVLPSSGGKGRWKRGALPQHLTSNCRSRWLQQRARISLVWTPERGRQGDPRVPHLFNFSLLPAALRVPLFLQTQPRRFTFFFFPTCSRKAEEQKSSCQASHCKGPSSAIRAVRAP